MGFAASFGNAVMAGIVAKAAPQEKPVLGRFPPAMVRFGSIGILLLWVTGLTMVFTKWGGFAVLPWQFHAKLTAVVLLTLNLGNIHRIMAKIRKGDAAAAASLPTAGRIGMVLAITAVIFAVLTFD